MKTYYKADRGVDMDNITFVPPLSDKDKEIFLSESNGVVYFEFDTETRYIDEHYQNGRFNTEKGKYGKELHIYDNPKRWICEQFFYEPDEVTEITKEKMDEELFMESL